MASLRTRIVNCFRIHFVMMIHIILNCSCLTALQQLQAFSQDTLDEKYPHLFISLEWITAIYSSRKKFAIELVICFLLFIFLTKLSSSSILHLTVCHCVVRQRQSLVSIDSRCMCFHIYVSQMSFQFIISNLL